MKKFSEFVLEQKGAQKRNRDVIFDILINNSKVFSHENADTIDKKLTQKKYKQELDNIKILRTSDNGMEDVTSLFIKKGDKQ